MFVILFRKTVNIFFKDIPSPIVFWINFVTSQEKCQLLHMNRTDII